VYVFCAISNARIEVCRLLLFRAANQDEFPPVLYSYRPQAK
jgi:hypothetical protein